MTADEFKATILVYTQLMYSGALSITGDREEAADCVQETVTRLWQMRDRLNDISNLRAYCLTASRRTAVDTIRRRRTSDRSSDRDSDTGHNAADPQTPLSKISERDDLRLVMRLLQKLPQRQREVVTMSGIKGLSNSEIREATGLSDENVRVLLSRGRKRLKELFSASR